MIALLIDIRDKLDLVVEVSGTGASTDTLIYDAIKDLTSIMEQKLG